jgi:hypothetical protein
VVRTASYWSDRTSDVVVPYKKFGTCGPKVVGTGLQMSQRASLEVEPGPDAMVLDASNELDQKPSSLEEKEALDRACKEDGFEASI